jgi:hypothetical protein
MFFVSFFAVQKEGLYRKGRKESGRRQNVTPVKAGGYHSIERT